MSDTLNKITNEGKELKRKVKKSIKDKRDFLLHIKVMERDNNAV